MSNQPTPINKHIDKALPEGKDILIAIQTIMGGTKRLHEIGEIYSKSTNLHIRDLFLAIFHGIIGMTEVIEELQKDVAEVAIKMGA